LCCACRSAPALSAAAPRIEPPRGDSVVIAGERFPIGTHVVLWSEPSGFNGYASAPLLAGEEPESYQPGRAGLGARPSLTALCGRIDQLVLHYDAAGSSAECFRILEQRNLSAHFLLDVDGTLYQTLDVAEQAWHATKANARSIGVEIAHRGAFPAASAEAESELRGARVVEGVVQGERLVQAEFPPEQLAALVKLAAGLCRALPRIRPEAPRDAHGRVRNAVLGAAEYAAFHGILGHFHVQTNKLDPGPAFPWEGFLAELARELGP
jgi:N-acetyl-anhydromuramyl-L-alanine amidase AmpD